MIECTTAMTTSGIPFFILMLIAGIMLIVGAVKKYDWATIAVIVFVLMAMCIGLIVEPLGVTTTYTELICENMII